MVRSTRHSLARKPDVSRGLATRRAAIDGTLGEARPDLTHIGQRAALAGSLSSDPGSLTAWIMHPQKLRPGSGMPDQGIDVREARDVAAYFYAQN
ncbi:hypothetical protein WG901_08485 [Novosphingobium sp. PS1R-30]|uniref:Cytochrome c domain-containing protein n=1 Tax=Novosphingobium anseongense TaxID=3133436 RepID=A0ABU8RUM8_9SPHN